MADVVGSIPGTAIFPVVFDTFGAILRAVCGVDNLLLHCRTVREKYASFQKSVAELDPASSNLEQHYFRSFLLLHIIFFNSTKGRSLYRPHLFFCTRAPVATSDFNISRLSQKTESHYDWRR